MTKVTGLINVLSAKLVRALHLPAGVAQVAQHVVLVFLTAFVAQVVGSHLAAISIPAGVSVLSAAAAAGASAAGHYLLGLVPSTSKRAVFAAAARAKATATPVTPTADPKPTPAA